MGKCAVCDKDAEHAFLFLPSNVWAFLCKWHCIKRLGNTKTPILEWIEKEKNEHS